MGMMFPSDFGGNIVLKLIFLIYHINYLLKKPCNTSSFLIDQTYLKFNSTKLLGKKVSYYRGVEIMLKYYAEHPQKLSPANHP